MRLRAVIAALTVAAAVSVGTAQPASAWDYGGALKNKTTSTLSYQLGGGSTSRYVKPGVTANVIYEDGRIRIWTWSRCQTTVRVYGGGWAYVKNHIGESGSWEYFKYRAPGYTVTKWCT